jgi:hypothetical protein
MCHVSFVQMTWHSYDDVVGTINKVMWHPYVDVAMTRKVTVQVMQEVTCCHMSRLVATTWKHRNGQYGLRE